MVARRIFGYRSQRLTQVIDRNVQSRLQTPDRAPRPWRTPPAPDQNIADVARTFGYGTPTPIGPLTPIARPTPTMGPTPGAHPISPGATVTPTPAVSAVPSPIRVPMGPTPDRLLAGLPSMDVPARLAQPFTDLSATRAEGFPLGAMEQEFQARDAGDISDYERKTGRSPSPQELAEFKRAKYPGVAGYGKVIEQLSTSVLPESIAGPVRRRIEAVPVVGPSAAIGAEFATSPVGIASAALAPGATAAGLAGQTALGAAGQALEDVGVSPRLKVGPVSIGPRSAGEIIGGLATPGMLTKPGRAALRAAGQQAPRSFDAEAARVAAGTGPFPLEVPRPMTHARAVAEAERLTPELGTSPASEEAIIRDAGLPEPQRQVVRAEAVTFRPDLFQARDADAGKAFSQARVNQLVRDWDPLKFEPPIVVVDPDNPGKYIAVVGHHRTEAFKMRNPPDADIDVRVIPADIRDPAQLSQTQVAAVSSNFDIADPNFRERVRAAQRLEDLGEGVDRIASLTRSTPGTVEAWLDAGRLGPGAVDRVVAEPTLGAIASELGRGVRVYGVAIDDGAGWFNRIAEAPKGQRPTQTALRETIDKFGRKLRDVPATEFAGFEDLGGTRGGILEIMDENARLRTLLQSQVNTVKRVQKQVASLAKGPTASARDKVAATRTVALAKREEARLAKEIAANERDVLAAFKQAQTAAPAPLPTVRPSTEPPPLVSRRDLFGEERPAFATEAELGGIRERQAPMFEGQGPGGALPTETAGPMFRQPEAPAPERAITMEIQTPERQVLRQQIADALYGTGAARKEKRLDIVIGGPASGKTTRLAGPLQEQHGSLAVNTDDARKYIPEYQAGVNEAQVHEEAAHVTEDLLAPRALGAGDNIIYDAVGKTTEKMVALAEDAKARGYKVYTHLIEASLEQQKLRAAERAAAPGGRAVSPEYITEVGNRPVDTYNRLREISDGYERLDNSGPLDQPPTRIESSGPDAETPLVAAGRAGSVLGQPAAEPVPEVRAPGNRRVREGLPGVAREPYPGALQPQPTGVLGNVPPRPAEPAAAPVAAAEPPKPPLRIDEELVGSSHGQKDLRLTARDAEGRQVGYLNYSEYQGEPSIQGIEVAEQARRQGIGRTLVEDLQRRYPDQRIDWGMTTPEGTALKEAVDPRGRGGLEYKTPERAALRQELRADIPEPESRIVEPEPPPPAPPRPPDAPPPSIGDGLAGEPPQTNGGLLARFQDRLPGRPLGQSDWAKYSGGLAEEGKDIDLGRLSLSRAAPSRHYRGPWRTPQKEALLLALHGEGPVPPGAERYFDNLQAFRKLHEERTLADVPSFEQKLLPQYWPRGWRNAKEKLDEFRLGQRMEAGEVSPADFVTQHRKLVRTGSLGLGAKPGTLRTRSLPLTFKEAIEQGWEPVSWDASDLISLHAAELADYRYSQVVGELFQVEGRAIPQSAAPTSWERTPYPAFEPKPFVTKEGTAAMSEPLVVSPEDAEYLKYMLGERPPTDITDVGAYATSVFKRAKVMLSYFQHLDLSIRLTNRSLTRGEVGFLPAGVKALAANFVPQMRPRLMRALLRDPEIKEGVEEGLQLVGGLDVFKREMRAALEPDLVVRAPLVGDIPVEKVLPKALRGPAAATQRRINDIYGYLSSGLFDGANPQYMGAFYKSVRKELAKAHTELTSRQVSALAAEHTNLLMSNIPEWQSVLRPRWRQLGRATAFSINELEAWPRQIQNAFWKGKLPGSRGLYMRQWAGYMFGTLAFAELMNYAITGELLTEDQYAPIRWRYKDENGFDQTSFIPRRGALPEYNSTFARPRLDGDGPLGELLGIEGGGIEGSEDKRHVYLDLLGQADTPFRMFSPKFFIMSRMSPQLSQAIQQLEGKQYFGEKPLEGTGGRLQFAAKELAVPIGASAAISGEGKRIGGVGTALQTVGLNVSAERLASLRARVRDEVAQDMFGKPYTELGNKAEQATVNRSDRVKALKEEGQRITLEGGGEARERTVKQQQEETLVNELLNQGSVGGEKLLRSTPAEFDELFLAGEIDADEWRDLEREFQMTLRVNKAAIRAALGTQFEEKGGEKNPADRAIDDYFDVAPLAYLDADKQFKWDEYFSAKENAYNRAVRLGGEAVAAYLKPLEEREVKRQYRAAQDVLEEAPGKYKNLSAEEARDVDEFVNDEVPAERLRLVRKGEDVKASDVARKLATDRGDPAMFEWYTTLKSQKKREGVLNPQYDDWRLQHYEELQQWFPWLYDDIGFYERTGIIPSDEGTVTPTGKLTPIQPLQPVGVR